MSTCGLWLNSVLTSSESTNALTDVNLMSCVASALTGGDNAIVAAGTVIAGALVLGVRKLRRRRTEQGK